MSSELARRQIVTVEKRDVMVFDVDGIQFIGLSSLCRPFGINEWGEYHRLKNALGMARRVREIRDEDSGTRIYVMDVEAISQWVTSIPADMVPPQFRAELEQWANQVIRAAHQLRRTGVAVVGTGGVLDLDTSDPVTAMLVGQQKITAALLDVRARQLDCERRQAEMAGDIAAVRGEAGEASRMARAAIEVQENRRGMVSILGFLRKRRMDAPLKETNLWGNRLGPMCRNKGIPVLKVDDVRYGEVNTYPEEALEEDLPYYLGLLAARGRK